MTTVETNYVADADHLLKNPERGFYHNRLPDADDYHTIVPAYLYLDDECNDDLTWAGVNHTSTSTVLKEYAQLLERYRAAGVKVLFRPRYDTPSDSAPATECGVFHANTIERQENHIRAVAAMLASYKDVVAFIQAGYLGRWGEWNTSDYSDSTAPFLHSYTTRERIIDYVLAQYELKQIKQDVELRRPVFAKEVLDRKPAANVGLHSGCFVLNDSHGGTYSDFPGSPKNFGDVEEAEAYAQSLTANASFGGETCNGWEELEGNEQWRNCTTMVNETAAMHMSYLNGDYATGAIGLWDDNGCFDDLLEKLGYRFEVTRVEYTPTVAAGQNYQVNIYIRNVGWARLHKPRDAKLVLRNGASTQIRDLVGGDVETWGPGETKQLSITAQAPSTPGTYRVRLWIPDPDLPAGYPTAKINYAVKLATKRNNANVFDQTTGENDLGVSITVQ